MILNTMASRVKLALCYILLITRILSPFISKVGAISPLVERRDALFHLRPPTHDPKRFIQLKPREAVIEEPQPKSPEDGHGGKQDYTQDQRSDFPHAVSQKRDTADIDKVSEKYNLNQDSHLYIMEDDEFHDDDDEPGHSDNVPRSYPGYDHDTDGTRPNQQDLCTSDPSACEKHQREASNIDSVQPPSAKTRFEDIWPGILIDEDDDGEGWEFKYFHTGGKKQGEQNDLPFIPDEYYRPREDGSIGFPDGAGLFIGDDMDFGEAPKEVPWEFETLPSGYNVCLVIGPDGETYREFRRSPSCAPPEEGDPSEFARRDANAPCECRKGMPSSVGCSCEYDDGEWNAGCLCPNHPAIVKRDESIKLEEELKDTVRAQNEYDAGPKLGKREALQDFEHFRIEKREAKNVVRPGSLVWESGIKQPAKPEFKKSNNGFIEKRDAMNMPGKITRSYKLARDPLTANQPLKPRYIVKRHTMPEADPGKAKQKTNGKGKKAQGKPVKKGKAKSKGRPQKDKAPPPAGKVKNSRFQKMGAAWRDQGRMVKREAVEWVDGDEFEDEL